MEEAPPAQEQPQQQEGAQEGRPNFYDSFANLFGEKDSSNASFQQFFRSLYQNARAGTRSVESLENPFTTGGPRGIGADPQTTAEYQAATGKSNRV